MTPFTVTNETSDTVRVTPVGAVGPEGRRSTLPLVFDLEIYVPHVRSRHFTIEPGRTLRLVYDSDDIQFSEIVVRQHGVDRVIIVDPDPTQRQYTAPLRREFTIRRFGDLPPASPEVAAAAEWLSVFVPHLLATSSIAGIAALVVLGRKLRGMPRAKERA